MINRFSIILSVGILAATVAAAEQKPGGPLPLAPPPGSVVRTEAAKAVALSPAEQSAALQRASDYFNGLGDLIGEFMQINPNGQQVTGRFYLSRPGKVRFDYAKPSNLQVISDGTTVAVRDRKLNTQDLYFLSQTPLRVILAERVNLAKDAKVLSVGKSDNLTTIVLEEKSIVGEGKLSVVFEGPDFELRQWTVTDPQGLDTTVAVYNIERGKRFDPSIFRIRFDY